MTCYKIEKKSFRGWCNFWQSALTTLWYRGSIFSTLSTVFNQIEDEADLDDAKRQEDRDKEKEKDPDTAPPPPNEDKAIEMSEDFDGAMEDAPATEVRSLMFIVLLYSLFSLCQPFYGKRISPDFYQGYQT